MKKLLVIGAMFAMPYYHLSAHASVHWGVNVNMGAPYYPQPIYYQQPVMQPRMYQPYYNTTFMCSYNDIHHNYHRRPPVRHGGHHDNRRFR